MYSSVYPELPALPFHIQAEALSSLKRHLSYNYPHPACGFLFGEEFNDRRVITQAIPSCSSQCKERELGIQLDPNNYERAEQYARRHDLKLWGLFRSFVKEKRLPDGIVFQTTPMGFPYCFISLIEGEIHNIQHLTVEK